MNTTRHYNFSLITYMDEKALQKALRHYRNQIKHYAYAFHDKDDNEPHFHVVVLWHNACTIDACKRRFKRFTDQNVLGEVLIDKAYCYDYLTHKNDEDKHHYDISIIKMDNAEYWQCLCYGEDEDDNRAVQIINDIINGVPLVHMVSRYGRDFVINFEKYNNMARMIMQTMIEKPNLVDEDGLIIK